MNAADSRRSWPSDETPIEDLDRWTRALNALRRGGVRTVGRLGRKTDADLLRLRGFGPGALAAVRAVVPPRRPRRLRQIATRPSGLSRRPKILENDPLSARLFSGRALSHTPTRAYAAVVGR